MDNKKVQKKIDEKKVVIKPDPKLETKLICYKLLKSTIRENTKKHDDKKEKK